MTQSKCPICSKPTEQKFNPFCSKRCADVDLSRWLKGSYAIPGRPAEDEGEATPGSQESGEKPGQKQPQDDPD
jgi:uncharacterized protein